MSLINEALKRTRDASYQNAATRAATVENNYRVSSTIDSVMLGTRSGIWVSTLALVMAGVAVLVFSLRVIKPGVHVRNAMDANSEANPTDLTPVDEPPPVAARKPEPFTVPVVTPRPEKKTAEDQLVDKVLEKLKAEQATAAEEGPVALPSPPEPVIPPSPESSKFTLQGITSGPGWREAMINGYGVREGEDVDGARVMAIEPRCVKLKTADHEILLRMP